MSEDFAVQMKDIRIEFPGVLALDGVNFEARKSEVHVLLGENGAGKSTLMKVLTGVYKQSEGIIFVNGKKCNFNGIKDSEKSGISMIFQELNLVRQLTVAENIFLGKEPKVGGFIDWKRMFNESQKLIDNLGVDIDSTAKLSDLTVAKQQMVEILKALSNNSEVIIMDEPTSSLTNNEIRELFSTIKELKGKGVCIIYISHRMEEIFEIGNRVTVLRDGKYVGTKNIKDTNTSELIRMMIGRELKDKYPKLEVPIGEEIIRVKNINQGKKLKNISFYARKGEIVGFAGLVGAGRTELMRAIFGAEPIESGEIFINGKKVEIKSPHDAIRNRMGFVTEDRKSQGLVLNLDVSQNITLASLKNLVRNYVINLKSERNLSAQLVKSLSIKTPSLYQKVKFLSGGNQQKVVLSKWLATNSDILIIDEPTRGIDVGAKVEIYKLIGELIKQGKVILMVSSELPEIIGLSDRVYVMHEGEIAGELTSEEATQERILHFATGGR
jgi:ribose transport system ATP-binding protein